jgi:nucleoside 2-deoxyribosyltransferase
MRVYLAGLLSPNWPESLNWRVAAEHLLKQLGATALIPKDSVGLTGDGVKTKVPAKRVVENDFNDLSVADVVLMRLDMWGETRQSIGTHAELGWCYILRKRLVIIAAADNKTARLHPFVKHVAEMYFETVEEAVSYITRGSDE